MDFGRPNAEIVQKMANGRLSLSIYGIQWQVDSKLIVSCRFYDIQLQDGCLICKPSQTALDIGFCELQIFLFQHQDNYMLSQSNHVIPTCLFLTYSQQALCQRFNKSFTSIFIEASQVSSTQTSSHYGCWIVMFLKFYMKNRAVTNTKFQYLDILTP